MAIGNTFGATALSSYGGFWLALAITLTPGGFEISTSIVGAQGAGAFNDSFGFFLMVSFVHSSPLSAFTWRFTIFLITPQGWFIFTTILLVATLRSTVAFFFLFFTLDLTFLLLGIGHLHRDATDKPNPPIIKAGGFFGLLAAFAAWYNALAGLLDDSNR